MRARWGPGRARSFERSRVLTQCVVIIDALHCEYNAVRIRLILVTWDHAIRACVSTLLTSCNRVNKRPLRAVLHGQRAGRLAACSRAQTGAQKGAHNTMAKISEKEQAALDAQAVELYGRFEAAVAEVAPERGPKRARAIRLAADLIRSGYSLRKAAKLAGRKPDTSYDRYFMVARALEADGQDNAVPVPDGFGNWLDAIAGMATYKLVEHVKAHKSPTALAPADKAMRSAVNAALKSLETLISGKAKGKAIIGLAVGKAALIAYVQAWADAGCSIKGLDSMTLPVLDAEGREITAAIKAGQDVQAALADMMHAGVPGVLPTMQDSPVVETGEVADEAA